MKKYPHKTKKYIKHHKKGGGEEDDNRTKFLNQMKFNQNKNMLRRNYNKSNRLKKVIQVACKTSKDNCVALGIYTQMIYHFFEDFQNFDLVDTPNTKRIGKPSKNGFIWSIPFKKEGLTAYSVLKCSANRISDNLYYEYYIGKHFINQYTSIYPCFVETYDCYQLSPQKWQQLYDQPSNVPFNDGQISKYEGGWKESCTNNELFSVLIQHFDSSRFISLHDIREKFFDEYFKYYISTYLYQVYFVLSLLGENYTHYDLHYNNVFCYRPYGMKEYIMMNYHSKDGEILSFPSEFIVKIIDYGRNYFDNSKTNTGNIMKNEICNNPKCNPKCGEQFGYDVIKGNIDDPNLNFHNIFPNKPNQSHDLRLLYIFQDYFKQLIHTKINYESGYGTPENLTNGFINMNKETIEDMKINGFTINLGSKVNNIHDAKNFLEFVIRSFCQPRFSKRYDSTWKQVGIINVYSDGIKHYEYINTIEVEDG